MFLHADDYFMISVEIFLSYMIEFELASTSLPLYHFVHFFDHKVML